MATMDTLEMQFVPMTTIIKKTTNRETDCSDWVATEKIHGSNFQFFTNDGENVHLASRRTLLCRQGSFLKCNMQEFHQRHINFIRQLFRAVKTDERWQQYRTTDDMVDTDDDEEAEEEGVIEDQTELENDRVGVDGVVNDDNKDGELSKQDLPGNLTENTTKEGIELRIYGELYGGGGIMKDVKSAVQKEIIYADDFRFYVFGININRKWTTVTEMNDLCQYAGFPYYATPVCPPTSTLEELTMWLTTSGYMKTRSKLTDKKDDVRAMLEGVVMTPLKRKDFRLHAVKLLASAFNDVRNVGKGKNQKVNYCTKARYNSVLSKLDLHEREDTAMVVDMFIADIIKEGGEAEANDNKRKAWTNCVRAWLTADGYLKDDGQHKNGTPQSQNSRKRDQRKQNFACETATPLKEDQNPKCDADENDDDIGGLFG